MKHPLDGARFKVVWAEKHLDSLKTEIGSYLSRHVNEVSSQPSRQPQHTWMNPIYTFPPIIPAQTELTLSAIIGDIITNARAALDYVMWELATKYFQPPLRIDKFADRKLASFPISNDPIEIKKCSDGLENRKLPTGAIHEIKAVQLTMLGMSLSGDLPTS